jgi:serine/threonine protein kinase
VLSIHFSLVGLAHLHGGSAHPIVHCDIKTANILLSEDMVAKVADFGVSKLILEPDASHVLTRVKGTFGYIDPMYVSKRDLHPLSIRGLQVCESTLSYEMQLRIILGGLQYLSKQNLLAFVMLCNTYYLHLVSCTTIFFIYSPLPWKFLHITKIRLILILLLFSFVSTGQLTKKSDVYSFGIVLLELICGCYVHIREKVSNNSKNNFYFSKNSNSFQAYL